MDEDSENVQNQSSSSSGNRKSKAGHEKPSFAEGLNRNVEEDEEDEEARRWKTVMFLKNLAREEKQNTASERWKMGNTNSRTRN